MLDVLNVISHARENHLASKGLRNAPPKVVSLSECVTYKIQLNAQMALLDHPRHNLNCDRSTEHMHEFKPEDMLKIDKDMKDWCCLHLNLPRDGALCDSSSEQSRQL